MRASSHQSRLTSSRPATVEPVDPTEEYLLRAAGHVRRRAGGWAVAALGFVCFLPYLAVGIGNRSAVQAGTLLSALMALPVLAVGWRGRPFWVYPALLAPLCVSIAKAAVGETGNDLDLCVKALIVWATSCLTLLPAQHVAPRHPAHLLTGVAAAVLLHAAVGAYQMYSFQGGVFPLPELYNNPSFLSVQDNARTIALWIRRPFGLFPEPSAMTASVAPFVLFWAAELCGLIRLHQQPSRWQRRVWAAAAAGGTGLMIVSQSGHAAVALAAGATFVAVWFARQRATARSYLAVLGVFGVLVPAVLAAATALIGERVGGRTGLANGSWEERSSSLVAGFDLLVGGGPATAVFGLGCGLSTPALWSAARLDAVWSVLLSYVYETGLVGGLAVAAIGHHLLRAWRAGGGGVAFPAIAGVWLVGVTLTTSYQQLLPLWLALGWLTVWPEICRAGAAAEAKSEAVTAEEPPVPAADEKEKDTGRGAVAPSEPAVRARPTRWKALEAASGETGLTTGAGTRAGWGLRRSGGATIVIPEDAD